MIAAISYCFYSNLCGDSLTFLKVLMIQLGCRVKITHLGQMLLSRVIYIFLLFIRLSNGGLRASLKPLTSAEIKTHDLPR